MRVKVTVVCFYDADPDYFQDEEGPYTELTIERVEECDGDNIHEWLFEHENTITFEEVDTSGD